VSQLIIADFAVINAELAVMYYLLEHLDFVLARVGRLELPTPGFGDQCSTN
jgi:hypothetical protein